MLNSITGDDRRFASPHAAAKLHVMRTVSLILAFEYMSRLLLKG